MKHMSNAIKNPAGAGEAVSNFSIGILDGSQALFKINFPREAYRDIC